MADSVPSPDKVVATLSGVPIMTETAAGRAAVDTISHPPGNISPDFCGFPDNSAANTVILSVKGMQNCTPLLTLPATAEATTSEYSPKCMFLSPSGGKVGDYFFIWSPGTGLWVQPLSKPAGAATPAVNNVSPPSVNNSGYNWKNFQQDVAKGRVVGKSSTKYFNYTANASQGDVGTAQFVPSILRGSNLNELFATHKGCKRSDANLLSVIRNYAKSKDWVDVSMDKMTLNDITNEYSFQCLEIDRTDAVITTFPHSDGYISGFKNLLCDSISEVINMSSKATARLAKEGSFEVQYQSGPILPWTTAGAGSNTISPVEQRSGPIISLIRNRIGNTFTYLPLYSENILNISDGPTAYTGDAPWTDMTFTITMFDGLTLPTTPATGNVSGAAYITSKTYCHMELQPQFDSSLRPFQRSRPPPDEVAVKMLTTIFHQRPDSLPASANDLGSIATTLVKMLPSAVGWLKDLFGGAKQKEQAMSKVEKFVGSAVPQKTLNKLRDQRLKDAATIARLKANQRNHNAATRGKPKGGRSSFITLPAPIQGKMAPLPRRSRKPSPPVMGGITLPKPATR